MSKAAPAVKPVCHHFKGFLGLKEIHDYFSYSFNVTEPAIVISAVVRYSGPGNYLGLTLYEQGSIRAFGRTEEKEGFVQLKAEVFSGKNTPGAAAGPILPGRWQAEISTNQIKRPCPFELTIQVWPGSTTPAKNQSMPPRPEKINDVPGWYRGDLHVHSTDSDGTKTAKELFAIALEKELDFLAITDHNNLFSQWKLPGKINGILPLPAMEITTFLGHANAFGINDWVDWRTGRNGRTINDIADDVHLQGGIFSVNHPCTPGLPEGHASWRHPDFDWHKADALEIWNAPVFSGGEESNRQCRALWDSLLNRGLRITGLGGSDAHYLGEGSQHLGLPVNYLYLSGLSRANLLQAIRQGRVFVTRGPEIYYYALSDSTHTLPGGTLAAGKIKLAARINCRGMAPLVLTVIKNGESLQKVTVPHDSFSYSLDTVADSGDWFRMELSEPGGEEILVAFTNPVYIG